MEKCPCSCHVAHSRCSNQETVGDCYVAATGLPKAQPDHAVIMVKFARDGIKKLREVINDDLVHRLGPDTANLSMRFGLHSGPVTAGVLKGKKGRFQIFGDTGKQTDLIVYPQQRNLTHHAVATILQSIRVRDLGPDKWMVSNMSLAPKLFLEQPLGWRAMVNANASIFPRLQLTYWSKLVWRAGSRSAVISLKPKERD